MNVEEAKEMVGTEFTYVYEDGDVVQCYIKKFDPDVGLTCITLETETRDGWSGASKEADGTFCVIAYDFNNPSHTMDIALADLKKIKRDGKYTVSIGDIGTCIGAPNCAF